MESGTYGILGVGHRVERSQFHREFINYEIVGVILCLDESAQSLLIFGTKSSQYRFPSV